MKFRTAKTFEKLCKEIDEDVLIFSGDASHDDDAFEDDGNLHIRRLGLRASAPLYCRCGHAVSRHYDDSAPLSRRRIVLPEVGCRDCSKAKCSATQFEVRRASDSTTVRPKEKR